MKVESHYFKNNKSTVWDTQTLEKSIKMSSLFLCGRIRSDCYGPFNDLFLSIVKQWTILIYIKFENVFLMALQNQVAWCGNLQSAFYPRNSENKKVLVPGHNEGVKNLWAFRAEYYTYMVFRV